MINIFQVIQALGFSESEHLYDKQSAARMEERSMKKIFDEINPAAVYETDHKPLIVFCEAAGERLSPLLIKKIWNAQIPLLIVSFQNHIEVYNGCSIDREKELLLLESVAESSINEAAPFSFWSISDSTFWQQYAQMLSAPGLDAVMLDNITCATDRLKQTSCEPFATKMILRLIFIRYLIDRGVDLAYCSLAGSISVAQSRLLTIMHSRTELYALFAYLKDRFNGNLFEPYQGQYRQEMDLLDEDALRLLRDLMSGELVLSSGQTSLFPLYDFNIIPVELISNIYEQFLGSETQKRDKAFYTPPYLVDYLLKQTVCPFLDGHRTCRILDPACGSGIFLVETARRLIEREMRRRGGFSDDNMLTELVTSSLWGIDKNPEAVDVAIFSLYITILDYKDPKTLKDFKLPLLKNRNFFVCDFFSQAAEKYLGDQTFDFIIGNPPWGSVDGPHIKYCRENQLPLQGREISRSFVLRTKDFSSSDTCCCLIVTSKLAYNTKQPSVAFRRWMLEKTQLETYLELAPVRELIFAQARGPAGVFIYKFNSDLNANKQHIMCHITLKPNIFFQLFHLIAIEKNDCKYIGQDVLLENDWAWKTLVFGTSHDLHLIKTLKSRCPSVRQIAEGCSFAYGRGIEVQDGDQQDAGHLMGRTLIEARRGIGPFYIDTHFSSKFQKERIHRAKAHKQDIFSPPYTLIKKGFDPATFKYRAAYSEEAFIYPDAVTGISGTLSDKETLLSLAGLFNSSVYAYLNLMLGASSGIEREQGFPTEILKYPAVTGKDLADLTAQIQQTADPASPGLDRREEYNRLTQELDQLVLSRFHLADDAFVDYVLNVQIPIAAENQMSWKKVTDEQLREYADVFTAYFSKIFSGVPIQTNTSLYHGIAGHYCAVEVTFSGEGCTGQESGPQNRVDMQMDLIHKFMVHKVNDVFYHIKDIISFAQNSFYILKTEEYKNWHPAVAKLDLADVLDSIFTGSEMTLP